MVIPPPNPDSCKYIGQVVDGTTCTLEGTLYGYKPNLAWNIFFAAWFAVCLMWQLYLGFRYKTWTYMVGLSLGCIGEIIGYAGRLMLHDDPLSHDGFIMQMCCLIIAPAFISAGIYLTLKHFVMTFGESWSRLKPMWYTRIFIAGDLLSLVFQGVGGGLASTSDFGTEQQDTGTDLMIVGVIFQVFILTFFGYFLTEYVVRTYRRRAQLSEESMKLFRKTSFRCFMGAILVAYVTIQVRCIYRIPELTGGWRSELMRNEPEFIVLEGIMIMTAVGVLTVFHPGYCFPVLGGTVGKNKQHLRGKSIESDDVEMMSG
ncbi:hypothetical protein ACEQ8H_007499 [Pleosporales sp. CAS-2024a]